MVSSINKIIILLKIKHELGFGKLTLLERRKGIHGHPQACGFASSCIILLPHHVMFHSKQ
jgi:hypothetical protein